MASGGPKSNSELYLDIFRTKDAAEKQEKIKALSATQKREYLLVLQQKKQAMKVDETKARIAAVDERTAVLKDQDRAFLTQASSSYAPKVGVVQSPVHTGPATDSAPRYGSKFSQ